MKSAPRCALFGLMIVLAISNGALASTITYTQLSFSTPVPAFGNGTDVTVPSTATGGYTFGGEFCLNEGCAGGPVSTFSDSLLRLTNLNLTCNSREGACAPIDINFEAQGGSGPTGITQVNVDLIGAGSASGFARVCIADSSHICSSALFGPESFSFSFANNVTGSAMGLITTTGNFDLLGDFHIDGLAPGASMTLSNSLDIGLTSAEVVTGFPGDPEPSTVFLLTTGLGALALLRRKFRTSLR
jgi:hypothetical protein